MTDKRTYQKEYQAKYAIGTTVKAEDKKFIYKIAELSNTSSSEIIRSIIEKGLKELRGNQ
ncbi:hypothetical protein [Neptuniibacter caesariensis]|uniref:Ribbon-helix-helix protein CopG domain-containing protein n=1 Tax=Neptuniibacter caesariensis TaxID=207954 RepID=A0A7U8GUA0_NEPCE|nr:hypothetical protein [Neptuniibacter caesariensis]EAR62965.1 hypothetical protein MED92_07596 [Oceanospirillum sp. MED92] [Neptuniibacter caesariensis]